MKEIRKVVQKLSREQKSVATGGGGGVRTGTINIKTVCRGDLISSEGGQYNLYYTSMPNFMRQSPDNVHKQ